MITKSLKIRNEMMYSSSKAFSNVKKKVYKICFFYNQYFYAYMQQMYSFDLM